MSACDTVYAERNHCIALAAKFARQQGLRAYIALDPATEEEEWRNVVFIELPTGQVSWHIHVDDLPLFCTLPFAMNVWDNHTTAQKYERVQQYVRE